MEEDIEGFLYPSIDRDRCINCDRCSQVCAFQSEFHNGYSFEKEVYAAVAADRDLSISSSGAVFPSIAQKVLEKGGVVCGCELTEEASHDPSVSVKHVLIDNPGQLYRLLNSKYVQSSTADIFGEIRTLLNRHTAVLFSGTPCQVAGLKSFLGREYDELFCIDLVCHGVPNIRFFRDYYAFIEQKYHIRMNRFCFRDKAEGWKLHGSVIVREADGREKVQPFKPEESSYYQLFLNGYTYRMNCYYCPYACEDCRPGDISIGDFWCIDLVHPEYIKANGGEIDETRGVSSLIINSDQGKKLMGEYGGGIRLWKSSYEQAARYNRQLLAPSVLRPQRQIVMDMYASGGYKPVEKWYQKRLRKVKFKRRLRSLVPKRIKKIIRIALNYRKKGE